MLVTEALTEFLYGVSATVTYIHEETDEVSVRLKSAFDEFPEGFLVEGNAAVARVPSSMVHLDLKDTDEAHRSKVEPESEVKVDWKNVLLLSGPAGSGKSTAVEKLELLILDEYYEHRKRFDGVTVVLLSIQLPKLHDPVSSVFEEGCNHAFGGRLRESQQIELLELAQKADSKLEIIFLLDAYDELPSEARFRNL